MMLFAEKIRQLRMTHLHCSHRDTISEQDSVSGVMLILLGTVLLCVLAVGTAFVLDGILGQFRLTWVALMLIIEVAFVASALFIWPHLRPVVRWNWLEIVGAMTVSGVFLAHALYLAPDDLMPVSFSVDCSNQHLLVNYIYQHNHFPSNVNYLYMYDAYPIAPSALAAFLARLVGVLPAQTMYPLAVLFVMAQVVLAFEISLELLPPRPSSYLVAATAVLMIFFVYSYSVYVFAERFYSNMMMGDLIVVLTAWVTTVRKKLSPMLVAGVTVCLAFGVLNSYPAWMPFVVAPLLVVLLLDQWMSVRGRWGLATAILIATLALTVVAIVDQWDFITWFAPSRDYRLLPSWQSLGGVFLLVVAWGLGVMTKTRANRSGFVLFFIMDIAIVAALYGASIMDKLSRYIPDKTFYFNVFLFTIFAACGLNWAAERVPFVERINSRLIAVIMMVIGVATIAVVDARTPRPNVYPITLDEYRVAYSVAQKMPDVELAYLVRSDTTFYWIYGAVLNHTPDLEAQIERWRANTPTYEKWIQDVAAPNRAIVSSLATLPQDGHWRIVIRSGNSGVIEKVQ